MIILPLFYGLPRSIYWTIKGKLKAKSSFLYIKTFLLWTFLFTLGAFLLINFLPSIAAYLSNSPGFFYGQWFGVIITFIKAISLSGRLNLDADFWSAMARYDKKLPSSKAGNEPESKVKIILDQNIEQAKKDLDQ